MPGETCLKDQVAACPSRSYQPHTGSHTRASGRQSLEALGRADCLLLTGEGRVLAGLQVQGQGDPQDAD